MIIKPRFHLVLKRPKRPLLVLLPKAPQKRRDATAAKRFLLGALKKIRNCQSKYRHSQYIDCADCSFLGAAKKSGF